MILPFFLVAGFSANTSGQSSGGDGVGSGDEGVLLSARREETLGVVERKAFTGVFLFLIAGVPTDASAWSPGKSRFVAAASSSSESRAPSSCALGTAPWPPNNATRLAVNSLLSFACLLTSSSTALSSHPNSIFLQALGKKLLNPSIKCCASVAQNKR